MSLPITPLADVSSVTVEHDGQTFEDFAIVTGQRPALRLIGPRPCGLVVIEYQAGYGATFADIPPDLALAIMDQTAMTFDTRGAADGKGNGMSPQMARIAARYRGVRL